jgi:hypothetical protein
MNMTGELRVLFQNVIEDFFIQGVKVAVIRSSNTGAARRAENKGHLPKKVSGRSSPTPMPSLNSSNPEI